MGAYEKRFKRMNDFFKERSNTNKVGFFEAQTKLKLKTSSSIRKPVQSKKDGKIFGELFELLLVISKTREVNLKEIFSYELSNTPLLLSRPDGTLHKSVKSELLEEIEKVKSIPHSQEKITQVIDGMALIQMVKAGNTATFGELSDILFGIILNTFKKPSIKRVDVVFDRYDIEDSIKSFEGVCRGSKASIEVRIYGRRVKVPNQW